MSRQFRNSTPEELAKMKEDIQKREWFFKYRWIIFWIIVGALIFLEASSFLFMPNDFSSILTKVLFGLFFIGITYVGIFIIANQFQSSLHQLKEDASTKQTEVINGFIERKGDEDGASSIFVNGEEFVIDSWQFLKLRKGDRVELAVSPNDRMVFKVKKV